MELLVPAGNWECLEAAVMHGADAVYLGGQMFSARKFADNFDRESLLRAVEFCHLYGVRVYVTVNTVVFDREKKDLYTYADYLSTIGVDAVIVQDLGAVSIFKKVAPKLPIHASTQMAIHDLSGVLAAQELGIRRVVLARELSVSEIRYIAEHSDMELEVFGHGALCMSYSGQCYMSSIIGGRSGNRGRCAQPCRLSYRLNQSKGQFLSLKDLCSLPHLNALMDLGVSSLKIEGRMKGPQYVGTVTDVYRACMDGKIPDKEDYHKLRSVFDRGEFTDGYLTGKTGQGMFSYDRPEVPYHKAVKTSEAKRTISISGSCTLQVGKPVTLTVGDGTLEVSVVSTAVAEPALHVAISRERILEQLYKTNDTPFRFSAISIDLEENCAFPIKHLNALRRDALTQLTRKRQELGKRESTGVVYRAEKKENEKPKGLLLYVSVETHDQALHASSYADVLFLPPRLWEFRDQYSTETALIIPRFATTEQMKKLRQLVERDHASVLVSDLGQVYYFKGLKLYSSFELNVTNSETLDVLETLGVSHCGVSYEMSLRRIRDLKKSMPLFVFAYGHMTLMLTRNCLVKSALGNCACPALLTDRTGASFFVAKGEGCSNEIRNGTVLFNADRMSDFSDAGILAVFLRMTTESLEVCEDVLRMYRGNAVTMPEHYTRGHLYKIVE